ncbi:MAG: hypothetical protein Q8R36_04015 [bacterium]|nr:hypothetical protein [bacterium]
MGPELAFMILGIVWVLVSISYGLKNIKNEIGRIADVLEKPEEEAKTKATVEKIGRMLDDSSPST